MSNKYILLTPAKNEERYIREAANSVIKQTLKPSLWIIVDDGSTDNTPRIIKEFEFAYRWIKTLTFNPGPRDLTFHISIVYKRGFEYAIDYSKRNNIDYDFIGLLDADTAPEEKYFQNLVDEFIRDESLGIASGCIYCHGDDESGDDPFDLGLPNGSGRLWRRSCFEETGGYQERPSADSISNVKAVLRGWKIKRFNHTKALQQRRTSSAEGLWKGHKINGFMAYYLNKHPLLVILSFMHLTTRKPFYCGFPFLYGYLLEIINRSEKIDDTEIRDYYWNNRLMEYINILKNKLNLDSVRNKIFSKF